MRGDPEERRISAVRKSHRPTGGSVDPRRRHSGEPRHEGADDVPEDGSRHERRIRPHRAHRRPRCSRRSSPCPPVPDGDVRSDQRDARSEGRPQEDRGQGRRCARRRAGREPQVAERRRGRARVPVRGAPGTPVRAPDRDDVRPRGRRQDEQEGDAEPDPARRDREPPLRRRPAPRVPKWMQKTALAMGAPMGRLFGFQPHYVPAGESAAATA